MYPKIENWKSFVVRVSLICQLIIGCITGKYKQLHLISVDEKTGIQALSRKETGAKEGKIKKQEYEYKRNGTTTLIGALEVSKGELIHGHLGATRNEKDFLEFCQAIEKLYPKEDKIVILADQLNIHKSATLVEWIAKEIGFKTNLGVKGKKGILKTMKTRQAFLETKTHRIRFVFTPKHCSWLNPIENWFGQLQRHVITGGNFVSVEDLNNKIRDYIEYYNRCLLKPLKWKFIGFVKDKVLENSIIV